MSFHSKNHNFFNAIFPLLYQTPKKLRQTPSRNSRRKVLGEKNSELSFSTTMSSNSWKPGRNTSISSVGSSCPSYTDFSVSCQNVANVEHRRVVQAVMGVTVSYRSKAFESQDRSKLPCFGLILKTLSLLYAGIYLNCRISCKALWYSLNPAGFF